uniref:Uncharacterized protein n=1 Tax=Leersia perrieri TaxID=77586 RepID=A0A0D9WYU6_9ORYZ
MVFPCCEGQNSHMLPFLIYWLTGRLRSGISEMSPYLITFWRGQPFGQISPQSPVPVPRHNRKTMEEHAAAASSDPPATPPPEDTSQSHHSPSASSPAGAGPPPSPGPRELAAAMEAVERDAAAIADSYASLFASLRLALSNVTSTSAENMDCLGDVVGRLQESGLRRVKVFLQMKRSVIS